MGLSVMLLECRVCGSPVSQIFHSKARSVLGITRPVDESLNVYLCEACGHGQSDDIDFEQYYSKEYRFELQAAEHDQLHTVIDGKPVYRADLQVQIVSSMVDIPKGAAILDYGAAKASTIRKLCDSRPDFVPSVFDVSEDYRELWSKWIPEERQACFDIPAGWANSFNVIFSFFVLEHVASPIEVLAQFRRLLRDDGSLVFVVPNPLENVGDLVVLEHVNHFTRSSIGAALAKVGLSVVRYSDDLFSGAHVVVAKKTSAGDALRADVGGEGRRMRSAADFLVRAQEKILAYAAEHPSRPCGIYGAGVYGSYFATRIEKTGNLRCFLDRNPQMWGMSDFGVPVLGPADLPDGVDLVFAGVNPRKAREWLGAVAEWRDRSVEIVFFD